VAGSDPAQALKVFLHDRMTSDRAVVARLVARAGARVIVNVKLNLRDQP
jgi:hypothetical protein